MASSTIDEKFGNSTVLVQLLSNFLLLLKFGKSWFSITRNVHSLRVTKRIQFFLNFWIFIIQKKMRHLGGNQQIRKITLT